jgi:hypothetical protein
MNSLLDQVSEMRSVKDVRRLALDCCNDIKLFQNLLELCSSSDKKVATFASWSCSYVFEKSTFDNRAFIHQQIQVLNQTKFSAVRRNILRGLQFVHPDENNAAEIAAVCLDLFSDQYQEIAVRAFAITVLEHCIFLVPEFMDELVFLLERELPHASPAIKVRGRNFLSALKKYSH